MSKLVNTTNIHEVNVLGAYPNTGGEFRAVTKCRAGWMTIVDIRKEENEQFLKYPESILTGWTKGSLQTVEFRPEGRPYFLTVFARKGNKIVLMDQLIMEHLTVGTINQYFPNTNLYSQSQYATVGAKTWADRAFVPYVIAGVDFKDTLDALDRISL